MDIDSEYNSNVHGLQHGKSTERIKPMNTCHSVPNCPAIEAPENTRSPSLSPDPPCLLRNGVLSPEYREHRTCWSTSTACSKPFTVLYMNRQIAIYEVQVSFFPCTRMRGGTAVLYYLLRTWPGLTWPEPTDWSVTDWFSIKPSIYVGSVFGSCLYPLVPRVWIWWKNIIECSWWWPLTIFRMIVDACLSLLCDRMFLSIVGYTLIRSSKFSSMDSA